MAKVEMINRAPGMGGNELVPLIMIEALVRSIVFRMRRRHKLFHLFMSQPLDAHRAWFSAALIPGLSRLPHLLQDPALQEDAYRSTIRVSTRGQVDFS